MYKSIIKASLLLSTTALCYPAHSSSLNSNLSEVIVSTANRIERPLQDEARSVSVIDASELSKVGAQHISELALRTPGVNINRGNGQEYLASIRSPVLTGAGACGAFLMAQDGIALRSAGFCNVNELFEGFTETAERIEVTRGPGSALYGSNALHGIINIITKPADDNSGSASIEGGSFGYGRLNLSKGYSNTKQGLRLTASIARDGGYRDESGFNQQKASIRHDYRGSAWNIASNISFTSLDQETAGYITGLNSFKTRDIAKTNPNPEAYRKAQSFRYHSKFSRDISDNNRVQITPYFRVLDMEFLMHFLPGKPLEENSQTSVGVQSAYYMGLNTATEITVGADVEYTKGSLEQTQNAPTVGSAFLQATIPSGKQYDYDVDSYMAAAFVQFDHDLSDKLSVTAGARLEHIKYDYTNNMVSGRTDENGNTCGFGGCRYSRPESGDNSYTAFSPKIGLIYSHSDNHQSFINLSHGFRAPQATELYRLQRAQTVADLKKVSLKSVELGFRGATEKLNYSLSAFYMEKDNYIFRDASFFNVSDGKSEHYGLELFVDFAITDTLSLRTNANIARHKYAFDYDSKGINLNGNDIDTAPRHFGSMQLNWQATEKLTAELEWVHMGSYYTDPENLHKYGGHDYLNLRVNYDVSEQTSVFLRVMNLTDTKYAERADYTTFTDERYFPGKPLAAYLGVKFGF